MAEPLRPDDVPAPDTRPVMAPVEFDPFAEPTAAAHAAADRVEWPLTSMQRELVAAVQMGDEANCAFNLVYALHLQGPLSHESMARALEQVARRHAALRMCVGAGDTTQCIDAALATELPLLELPDALDDAGREQALAALLDEETATPFDIHQIPLWRARLLRWDRQRHVLVLSIHHLAADGWSSSVLFGDLARAYAADRFGVAPTWPAALDYADFVAQHTSDDYRAQEAQDLAWWQAVHTPPAPPVALPTDRPRPALKTLRCQHARLALDDALSAAVRSVGARHGCTPFVTLLAAFLALVARLSGSRDIVVGVPIAVQTRMANAHTVADGANTVPLRVEVDVDQTFADQLPAVRRAFLDAQAHATLSFGNLVHALKLPRDPSRTPLVDVLFNIDRSGAPFDFGELQLVRLDTPKSFSNAEWSLNVMDDGRSLVVECHTLAALVDPATAQHWLQAYAHGLRRLTADPACPLAEAFVPTAEAQARIDAANATARAFPRDERLEQRLRAQAQRTPDAPAVWFDGQPWTYAELDARADGIAAALQRAGVTVGSRVGLHAGRHASLLAAVFGVLRAGAAYVPLDPAYPPERLAFMAEDASLSVVLCDEASVPAWTASGTHRIVMEHCEPAAAPLAPPAGLDASQPAYVIYTSGSTGRPKGVVVAHRSVMNYVHALCDDPGFVPGDRMAAVTTLSFDMSVPELFLPMMVGASVVMVARDEVRNGAALARRLAVDGVTVLQAAPSIWQVLLDSGWSGQPGLRAFTGGEPLSPALAQALLARCDGLWNLYGPTETTVFSTLWPVQAPERGIRIGRPVANTRILLLDERLRPVPLGAVGEICIGGEGVAVGYLGRPELTAERFVSEPGQPGARLYRTGDLGRWTADGTLDCLGRRDQQIKLRGHRIELGEVECGLLEQPGVRQALVALDLAADGEARLVAGVVTDLPAPDPRELREQLRRRLPEFMLPSQIAVLPSLPLLPNGKTDRAALPEAVRAATRSLAEDGSTTASAAWSPAESTVAQIWQRHLGPGRILPTDNFFDLGGHSLLAARVSAEMEAALGHAVGVPRLVMESLAQVARPSARADVPTPRGPEQAQGWLQRWAHALRRG